MNMAEAGKLGAIASLKTHNKNKELRVEKYNKNPTKCFTCSCIFPYESRNKKFCNSSCAAKTNNLGVIRNKINYSDSCFSSSECKSVKFKPDCLNCGKQLDRNSKKYCSLDCFRNEVKFKPDCLNCGKQLNRNSKKYCSLDCFNDYNWKLKKEQISLRGKAYEIRQAKKYLKEVRGNSCEMCGIDSWAGKPILLLCDHINGNPVDYNLENLRLICSNCDATTPFYKGKNKGNGRAYRRQRYREGKSF